jgi:hypothetical protein
LTDISEVRNASISRAVMEAVNTSEAFPGGVMVIVFAFGPKVCGFKPGQE